MKEVKIIKETLNPLFGRKEITIEVSAKTAPGKAETFDFLAEKFKTPKENIKIKKISGKFGTQSFFIETNIYKSKEEKYATELYSKKEKDVETKIFAPKVEKTEGAEQGTEE